MEEINSLVSIEGRVTLDRGIRDRFSEEGTSDLRRHSEKEPVHMRREEARVPGRGKTRCTCPEVAVSSARLRTRRPTVARTE